ncbi:MAG: ABC transporter permease, partial [Ancrocorticia populi]
MSAYRSLSRNLLKFDLRDWSTLIFTFIFPAALLIILVLTLGDAYDGMNLTGPISANVIAFGAAFVGIYAGATHLALWRENGMFNVLRNFPLSSNTVLGAQATAGTVLLLV